MAAAALGHAARRLGGSGALPQTHEAAVSRLSSAVEGRLMPRRLAHTDANPCTCGKFVTKAELNQIEKMKEELYEASAKLEKKFWMEGRGSNACRTNRLLLRQLTDHVCRRSSGDPIWEWARESQVRDGMLKATGFLTLVAAGTCLCFKGLYAM